MSSLNLVRDAWIPAQSPGEPIRMFRPAEIAADLPANSIAWPRADFRISQLEFLIGLLATCCAPDEDQWESWWQTPPDVATLDAAFAPFVHAFNLDGEGPLFMQDFDALEAGVESIEKLLIEAPGKKGVNENTDLLVKRGRANRLSRSTAAIALYSLQSWAPEGGAGIRTGLRGGGPLLTLVLPERKGSLWHLLWANVPCGKIPATTDLPRVFPWLAPTQGSQDGYKVTPANAHIAQVWWGMPRRIRLVFEQGKRSCDLTAMLDHVTVTGWLQRPHGAKYEGWSRAHPLTPYRRPKPNDPEWLPVHPKIGGIGYRDWLGLVLASPDGTRIPANCITEVHARGIGRHRLLAAGFDMRQMKARSFVESEMPIPGATDAKMRLRIDSLATSMVRSAEAAASITRKAIRDALFSGSAKVKDEWEILNLAQEKIWEETETSFFSTLSEPQARLATDERPHPEHHFWLRVLRRAAIDIFDELAPLAADMSAQAARVSNARRGLFFAFAGYGSQGQDLYKFLNIPPPEKGMKAKARKAP